MPARGSPPHTCGQMAATFVFGCFGKSQLAKAGSKKKKSGSRHAYKQSLWIAVDYNIIINGAPEQPTEVVTGVFLRICMRSY